MEQPEPTGAEERASGSLERMVRHRHIAVIDGTRHSKCQLCGQEAELRPYGPNGESVCFDCGMKDEEAAKRQFAKLLTGNEIVVIK